MNEGVMQPLKNLNQRKRRAEDERLIEDEESLERLEDGSSSNRDRERTDKGSAAKEDDGQQSFTKHSNRFTASEVEALIQQAQEEALRSQGSAPMKGTSQEWRQAITALLDSVLSEAPGECTLGMLGKVLCEILSMLDEAPKSCRPRSMSSKRSVFPLPAQ